MIAPYFDPTEMMSNIACLRGIVAMAKERKERGISIAAALNCHYDGIQSGFGKHPAMMQFTDNVTHSTTYGNSFKEVKENLERMRKDFGR